MKKLLIVPVLAMIVFASCKKDFNCKCTSVNVDTSIVSFEIEETMTVSAKNESKAKDACDAKESVLAAQYTTEDDEVTTNCEIQ